VRLYLNLKGPGTHSDNELGREAYSGEHRTVDRQSNKNNTHLQHHKLLDSVYGQSFVYRGAKLSSNSQITVGRISWKLMVCVILVAY
jgi:hypothetical protein